MAPAMWSLEQVLVLTGTALASSAAGVLVGARLKRRVLERRLVDETQVWLDHRAET